MSATNGATLAVGGTLNVSRGGLLAVGGTAADGTETTVTATRIMASSAGTLNINDGANVSTAYDIYNLTGGAINLTGGSLKTKAFHNDRGGSFTMTGGRLEVIDLYGDLDIDGGVFAPGNSPAISSISGNYTQGAESVLEIELAGIAAGDYDLLNVGGDAFLSGTLEVAFLDDFLPSPGDFYTFLTATTIHGAFDDVILPTFDGGFFRLVYGNGELSLAVLAETPLPPAAWMFFAGLVGFGWMKRRRAA